MTPWGYPWHGLYKFGASGSAELLRVGAAGPELPLNAAPFPAGLADSLSAAYTQGMDVHLVRVPGTPAIDMTPEEAAEQTALGRTWQDYTLLHTDKPLFGAARGVLHGRDVGGWICCDEAGGRWLVQPAGLVSVLYDLIDATDALTIALDVLPFGALGQAPATPTAISTTLLDLQQAEPALGGDPGLVLKMWSIASHGREATIALYPGAADGTVAMPCGWLRLQLTGTGPSFGLALSVLHGRETTMGAITLTGPTAVYEAASLVYTLDEEINRGIPTSIVDGGSAAAWLTSFSHTSDVLGMILSVVFDDSDALVTTTADKLWSCTMSGTLPTGSGFTADMVEHIGYFTLSWSGSYNEIYDITISRNGATVDSATHTVARTYSHSEARHEPFLVPSGAGPYTSPIGPLPGGTWAWSGTVDYTVGGASRYSAPITWLGQYIAPVPADWGSNVTVEIPTLGEHTTVSYELLRMSNQVLSATHALDGLGGGTALRNTHRVIAAQAIWNNPVSSNQPLSARGSYEPSTHELVVLTDDSWGGSVLHI